MSYYWKTFIMFWTQMTLSTGLYYLLNNNTGPDITYICFYAICAGVITMSWILDDVVDDLEHYVSLIVDNKK